MYAEVVVVVVVVTQLPKRSYYSHKWLQIIFYAIDHLTGWSAVYGLLVTNYYMRCRQGAAVYNTILARYVWFEFAIQNLHKGDLKPVNAWSSLAGQA